MKRILGSINDVIQLFAAILTTRLEQLAHELDEIANGRREYRRGYEDGLRDAEWVTAPDGEQFRRGQCQGHAACNVTVHEHGCYADLGNCDHPEEHGRPVDHRRGRM